MSFRKCSTPFWVSFCCLTVVALGILFWVLLDSEEDVQEDLPHDQQGNIKSASTGFHVVEGHLNATNNFSGFSWWEECITVALLLLSFVVYKIVRYRCSRAPTTVIQTDIVTAPVPTPAAPPPAPIPMQQIYPPPPSYFPLPGMHPVHSPPTHQYTGYSDYVKQKKTAVTPSVIDESSDSSSASDNSIPQPEVKPPAAEKKKRPRKKKTLVTENKENTVKV